MKRLAKIRPTFVGRYGRHHVNGRREREERRPVRRDSDGTRSHTFLDSYRPLL